eukprot:CAMPEP_0174840880 /NCGR_PEP_ID=MMETSP1114-20130205/8963_1 /TAXON_ID=312471 /ORGANISM="Neobodo designis, Strain CCAP 1951/1" /LENGTH=128 /DNA_ID=CAMNT_0016075049 /DNA_START=12 /DNA_END=398 /DNA_ORIENTATION=-
MTGCGAGGSSRVAGLASCATHCQSSRGASAMANGMAPNAYPAPWLFAWLIHTETTAPNTHVGSEYRQNRRPTCSGVALPSLSRCGPCATRRISRSARGVSAAAAMDKMPNASVYTIAAHRSIPSYTCQ